MKIFIPKQFLGQYMYKSEIKIFRGALFILIWKNLNALGTLIEKVTPDSSYLGLKILKSGICFSGFPKFECQGCHISEGAG